MHKIAYFIDGPRWSRCCWGNFISGEVKNTERVKSMS